MNQLTSAEMIKRAAVLAALQDARAKGSLGVAAAVHNIAESKLRHYAQGDEAALTQTEIDWLAVELKV
jgi:hypothetical protein